MRLRIRVGYVVRCPESHQTRSEKLFMRSSIFTFTRFGLSSASVTMYGAACRMRARVRPFVRARGVRPLCSHSLLAYSLGRKAAEHRVTHHHRNPDRCAHASACWAHPVEESARPSCPHYLRQRLPQSGYALATLLLHASAHKV